MIIKGKLTRGGSMAVDGEFVCGLFVRCSEATLKAVEHLPMYESVAVIDLTAQVDAGDWTVREVDYNRLYLAALDLRLACKDRLPPGHYDKLFEECRAIDVLARPSSLPARSK